MNVELHIERLVLDGIDIPPGRGEQLRAAVSAELTRLLRDGGLSSPILRGGTVDRLHVPSVKLPAPGAAADLGRFAGGAIYEGLTT